MSPSAGIIRENYEPVSISQVYESNGSAAISVLTDSQFFGGSLEDMENVSKSVRIPVMRKDFIIDESQIYEARARGASAILLIVRILDQSCLKRLLDYSHSLGMGVLVETHTADEVQRALDVGSIAIGVNTRDLDTFKIRPELISELASLIPRSCIRIGESGIERSKDWISLQGIVDGLLVGSYFMKHPDIDTAYKSLFPR